MDKGKILKFCLLGRGSIGTRHLNNLKSLGFHDLAAFSEMKDPAKDQAYVDKYNVCTLHSIDEVKRYRPNVFIIANPTSEHVKSANLALECDAHIFMEKPLSDTAKGVRELRRKIKAQKKIFFQANCLRFHPAVRKIKEMIDSGDLGKIYFAQIQAGQFLPDWHPREDYRSSYAGKKSLGGGVILTLQHEIDYAYWFFGKFSKVKAFARTVSDLQIDVEDVACVIAETQNRQLIEIHLDFLQRPSRREIHVHGNKGAIDYRFGDSKLYFYDFKRQASVLLIDLSQVNANQMYLDEMRHFINCIQNNDVPIVNIDDAVAALNLCLEIKRKSL